MNNRSKTILLALFGALFLFPGRAWAYLDPGTGSFILQMLIGAVLGGLVAIGVFWRRFFAWLRRLFGRGGNDDHKSGSG
ncbi:MAG TPA: hypothetical protein ENN51_08300 [candidate division WOR-3 bacterium]|uniref:Uncharacterized protein n=1 Tax=candidate division WOR-3 bacterium TaxID=2052148 RepID=A0A7V0XFX9_UNCW3|nr:hypothetical protein [candidate division WOR-3 bacterium]